MLGRIVGSYRCRKPAQIKSERVVLLRGGSVRRGVDSGGGGKVRGKREKSCQWSVEEGRSTNGEPLNEGVEGGGLIVSAFVVLFFRHAGRGRFKR